MASGGKSKYKHQQLESLMLNILDNALKTEINDEKLKQVAFTCVKLSDDGTYLDVYVDCWDRSKVEEQVKRLNYAKGVFRTAIAKKSNLYKVPQVVFHRDEAIDNNLKIEDLLSKINNK